MNYSNLARITAELSDAPDVVTIDGPNLDLVMDTAGGADTVLVTDLLGTGSIDLGDDADADQITVKQTSAELTVTGSASGVDTLIVDLSTSSDAVTAGSFNGHSHWRPTSRRGSSQHPLRQYHSLRTRFRVRQRHLHDRRRRQPAGHATDVGWWTWERRFHGF